MKDFRYAGFWISKDCLEYYIKETVLEKRGLSNGYYNTNTLLTTSVIGCIANNDVEFNVNDPEIVNLVQDLIIKCGKN